MIIDENNKRVTPYRKAKGVFYFHGEYSTNLSFMEIPGMKKATNKEIEEFEEHLQKIKKRVRKYLGI